MKKALEILQRVLLALLSLAVVLAPQLTTLIPENVQAEFYTVIVFYEAFVRWVPTAKSWSLLTQVINLVKLLAPDKAKEPKTVLTHD